MGESEYLKRPDAQGHLKVMEALRRWDPIGVFKIDANWPKDEYDMYSGAIVGMLDQGVSVEELARHLQKVAKERMEIETDYEHDKAIAEELVTFWKTWKSS